MGAPLSHAGAPVASESLRTVGRMTITVSTDGSALGNPNGPMGWAWADHDPHAGGRPGHRHPGDCDAGGATNGTNQIGELCAVLEALRAHPGSEPLVIETDSQYAINCATTWVRGWKRNGWRNSQKQPVKNAPLIKAIDAELSRREGEVRFVWVKGHAGNAGNEKVDELARTYAGDCRSGVRDGYLPREGWQSLIASDYAKGLDVPSDAQLLLDGAIDDDAYHLGRGPEDADTDGDSGDGAPTEAINRTRVLPAVKRGSLAERLAEPEGVPDYPFGPRVAGSTAAFGGDPTATTVLPRKADGETTLVALPAVTGSGFGDDVDTVVEAADDNRAVDDTAAPSVGNAADGAAPADAGVTDAVGDAADRVDDADDESDHGNARVADADDARTADAAARDTRTTHDARRATGTVRRRSSGLSVSGTLRFSPPPASSPTYDGRPRFIRGTITVEGFVQGDGTIVLDCAEFDVRHA